MMAFRKKKLWLLPFLALLLLAADVTEAYQKTLALEEKKTQLYAINRKLAGYNREIVDLTTQAEILAARARLHDEIGTDLLVVKKLLRQGVNRTELRELRRRLQRSVSCLKEDSESQGADEFTVLLETARRLGVRMEIDVYPFDQEKAVLFVYAGEEKPLPPEIAVLREVTGEAAYKNRQLARVQKL